MLLLRLCAAASAVCAAECGTVHSALCAERPRICNSSRLNMWSPLSWPIVQETQRLECMYVFLCVLCAAVFALCAAVCCCAMLCVLLCLLLCVLLCVLLLYALLLCVAAV